MPILSIEIVLRPNETLRRGLAAELADRAGEVFGSAPGETWIKLTTIPAGQYAEAGGLPPGGVYPVFVSVLKARYSPTIALQAEITRLTAAIAQACARPEENVHLFYQPEARGRVAFGGKLVLG
jgi:phenylpyruvate tautomerase PptA (4-oxalocrotonate tautomerase family)